MAEISELIANGSIDYITGKWLGSPCGHPRTERNYGPMIYRSRVLYNKYGYSEDDWNRMKSCSKMIVKFLYDLGYRTVLSRQKVIDGFLLKELKLDKLPKNSRSYHIINSKYGEFKNYVKQLKLTSK